MLGYISVVKQKVKEGMTEEYVALVKSFGIEGIKGARRRDFIEVDEHNFILIFLSMKIFDRSLKHRRHWFPS